MGLEAPHIDAHIRVLFQVKEQGQEHRQDLAQDRSCRRAPDTHGREAEQAEDHDRVHDVDDRPQALGEHVVDGPSGRLEDPLQHHLPENAEGEYGADLQVLDAVFDDHRIVGLAGKIDPGGE